MTTTYFTCDNSTKKGGAKGRDSIEVKTVPTIDSARRAAQLKSIEQLIQENAEIIEKLGPE